MVTVSVLMAVFNGEKTLPSAVKSILTQTFQDWELIVVDDASVDQSLVILKKFAQADSRIKIITNKKNLGLTKSLNIGLKHCRGKYIARQDADDISLRSRLATQLNYFQKNPHLTAVGSNIEGNQKLKFKIKQMPSRFEMLIRNPFIHSTMMIKATVLKKVKYDENFSYAQDYKLWLELISQGYRLENIATALVKFNLDGPTISNSKKFEQRYCAHQARLFGFHCRLFPWFYRTFLIRSWISLIYYRRQLKNDCVCIFLPSLKGGAAVYVQTFLENSTKKYYLIAKNDVPELATKLATLTQDHFFYRRFNLWQILNWLKQRHLRLIFAQGLRAIHLSRLLKVFLPKLKIVSIYHGYHFAHYPNFLKRIFFVSLEKLTSFLDNGKIFLTKSDQSKYGQTKNSTIIANEIIFPDKLKKNSTLRKGLTIGYIGRFSYEKGFDLILATIESFAKKNNCFNFLIKGSGKYQEKKLQYLQKNFKKLKVLPYDSNLKSFYQKVDLVIFPSRWEGLPLGVMEATGYGVPIIATNVCGNKDLLNSDNSILLEKPYLKILLNILEQIDLKTLRRNAIVARKYLLKSHGQPQRMVKNTELFIDKIKR